MSCRVRCALLNFPMSVVFLFEKNNIFFSYSATCLFFPFLILNIYLFVSSLRVCLRLPRSSSCCVLSFLIRFSFIHFGLFFFFHSMVVAAILVCVCAFVLRFLHFLIWFFWHIVRIMLSLPLDACFADLLLETINVKIIITVKGTSCVCSYEKLWK